MSPFPRRAVIRGALLALLLLSCNSSSSSSASGEPATSCAAPGDPTDQPPATTLFGKAITSVTVEIDYAPGAEPYEGSLKGFGDLWTLFHSNALAIFDGKKTLSVPTTVAKMEKLDDVPAQSFSNKDILDIAARHRNEPQYANGASFYVVFLNGYWIDESCAENKEVLGVSIGKTGVIGMFKPAIAATSPGLTSIIEQLTLIHNFGHAVGFVDNGVTVSAKNQPHVDANGHHCVNKQCAMSSTVESPAGAATFAATYIRSPQGIILAQDCLSDARVLESELLTK